MRTMNKPDNLLPVPASSSPPVLHLKVPNKHHKTGHFAAEYKTKAGFKRPTRRNTKGDNRWKGVSKSVNSVDAEDGYAFHVSCGTTTGIELIDVHIWGVDVYNVMIDSGSRCNIINKSI